MSTPLMKQYARIKAQYPGTILLFRMGDFFETFEEDAKITASVLGITLTKRGNGAAGEIPLAGFPHHALDAYLPKLLKAGYRVAVCEQMEDPRFARGIVKRDVIEVVTPGIAFSDRVLEQKRNNYLAAVSFPSSVVPGNESIGFAYVDVSTAEFRASEFPLHLLREQIRGIAPSELIVQKRDETSIRQILGSAFTGLYTILDDWLFNPDYAQEILTDQLKTRSLKGFGLSGFICGVIAAGAIVHYLRETQRSNLLHLRRIIPYDVGDHIAIDPSTKRNLEISASIAGTPDGTLFGVLDHTVTPMGGRLFKQWINNPLNRVDPIQQRLDAVQELIAPSRLREDATGPLRSVGDLERLNTRICTGRASPRDLVALRSSLSAIGATAALLSPASSLLLGQIRDGLHPLPEIADLLDRAIEAQPPATRAEGGVIRTGFNSELDELRGLASSGKQWISTLQQSERARTGIPSLKVGYNTVFGYYIEITNPHKDKVPAAYIRKQTLTNAERYVTPELKDYEEKILHAEERILAVETRIFNEVRLAIAEHSETIQLNAVHLATLDCLCSLAGAAAEYDYIRPEVNDSTVLEITGGRHPVIERLLPPGEPYVPNDVRLDTSVEQILIVTGPNMSGKSSFLRQTGLIVLLAQIGSFVPARRASIGIVDRIFTRVGASDNIASGESTFLVEMHEAAHIVNAATERSLILLDEIGRGTSTFDGISIAWALTEYLHEHVGARTLFATHYHELNELADHFPRVRNFKVDVREYGDTVVFLHKVSPGIADHSYGIHVAKMAGLPDEITNRAGEILNNLEGSDLSAHHGRERKKGRVGGRGLQMTLFEMKDEALRADIASLNVDSMTPLEALRVLASLQNKVRST